MSPPKSKHDHNGKKEHKKDHQKDTQKQPKKPKKSSKAAKSKPQSSSSSQPKLEQPSPSQSSFTSQSLSQPVKKEQTLTKGPINQKINQFTWNIDWLAVNNEPQEKKRKIEPDNISNRPAPPMSFGKKSAMRSKVYSGTIRNMSYTKVPSLEELCLQVLMDNHTSITYLGDAPYYLIKPVLEKCTPNQLFTLEDYNPRLTEDDDELWKWHCEKEFKDWEIQDSESWRDLYIRAEEERKRKLERITRTIDMKEKSKGPVRKTQLAFTDTVPKAPRNIRKLQEKKILSTPSSSVSRPISSGVSSPASTAPSSAAKPKSKGFLMKNCLKMMHSIRRQNC